MPWGTLSDEVRQRYDAQNVKDYGMELRDGVFEVGAYGCVIEKPLALAYALAMVTQGKAKHVWMVGMDGYDGDDERNRDILKMLDAY